MLLDQQKARYKAIRHRLDISLYKVIDKQKRHCLKCLRMDYDIYYLVHYSIIYYFVVIIYCSI